MAVGVTKGAGSRTGVDLVGAIAIPTGMGMAEVMQGFGTVYDGRSSMGKP